jgi:hypothetical protein
MKPDISKYPLAARLDLFAGRLPSELRPELYDLAAKLMHTGATNGIFANSDVPEVTAAHLAEQDAWSEYFAGKRKESADALGK